MNDYIIRKYIPEDKDQVSVLWKTIFDDDIEFIDFFLDTFLNIGDGYVCADGENIVSIAFLLGDLFYKSVPCHYLYAVATDPAYRSKGIASEVVKTAVADVKKNNHIILTAPADNSLVSWYQINMESEDTLTCSIRYVEKNNLINDYAGIPIARINADEYLSIRENLLLNYDHIVIGKEYMKIQEHLCKTYQGALIKSGENIAAVYLDEKELYCPELLCTPSDLEQFIKSIMDLFGVHSVTFRTSGKDKDYVSLYTPVSIPDDALFNLILD